MKLIQDKIYPNMYWLQWPDGVLSHDFYNLTRAREHLHVVEGSTGIQLEILGKTRIRD